MTREHERRRKRERLRGEIAFLIADACFPDQPYDRLLGAADAILVEFSAVRR